MKVVVGRSDVATAAMQAVEDAGGVLERIDVSPVHQASAGFLKGDFEGLCELAIVTMLQAVEAGSPAVLLPITTLGRFQHQTLVTMGDLTVDDVAGHSVGVRSWSQTTGVWMRGFLTDQYGVDLRSAHWVVYQPAHIAEFADPDWVHQAAEGVKLPADFLAGTVDFGIMGNELPDDPRIRTAIPDARQAAEEWSRKKGFAPINHVMAVSVGAAREASDQICAAYDAMARVIDAAPAEAPVNFFPTGFEALRGPFSQAAEFAYEQGVLNKPVEFDEVVDRSCDALGVTPARLGG